jgi:hypothetical protein
MLFLAVVIISRPSFSLSLSPSPSLSPSISLSFSLYLILYLFISLYIYVSPQLSHSNMHSADPMLIRATSFHPYSPLCCFLYLSLSLSLSLFPLSLSFLPFPFLLLHATRNIHHNREIFPLSTTSRKTSVGES